MASLVNLNPDPHTAERIPRCSSRDVLTDSSMSLTLMGQWGVVWWECDPGERTCPLCRWPERVAREEWQPGRLHTGRVRVAQTPLDPQIPALILPPDPCVVLCMRGWFKCPLNSLCDITSRKPASTCQCSSWKFEDYFKFRRIGHKLACVSYSLFKEYYKLVDIWKQMRRTFKNKWVYKLKHKVEGLPGWSSG